MSPTHGNSPAHTHAHTQRRRKTSALSYLCSRKRARPKFYHSVSDCVCCVSVLCARTSVCKGSLRPQVALASPTSVKRWLQRAQLRRCSGWISVVNAGRMMRTWKICAKSTPLHWSGQIVFLTLVFATMMMVMMVVVVAVMIMENKTLTTTLMMTPWTTTKKTQTLICAKTQTLTCARPPLR